MTSDQFRKFDFATSYASPDQPFVEEVVQLLKARGVSVFFAPHEQADIVGRNLIDYLSEVYLNKARYCLVFLSRHYAERKWTNKVERPVAETRQFDQEGRYIIPVRLDDAEIKGLLPTIAYIRAVSPMQVADLAVSILLRDEPATAATTSKDNAARLLLRVTSFTEFDTVTLKQSFRPFEGFSSDNAGRIPVELRLPEFLMKTIRDYEELITTGSFKTTIPRLSNHLRSSLVAFVRRFFQVCFDRSAGCYRQVNPTTRLV